MTSAGPAPLRMMWPAASVSPAAAVPIAPNIPAPITAPIASMMRSPAPSARLSALGCSPSTNNSEIGFREKREGMKEWRERDSSVIRSAARDLLLLNQKQIPRWAQNDMKGSTRRHALRSASRQIFRALGLDAHAVERAIHEIERRQQEKARQNQRQLRPARIRERHRQFH